QETNLKETLTSLRSGQAGGFLCHIGLTVTKSRTNRNGTVVYRDRSEFTRSAETPEKKATTQVKLTKLASSFIKIISEKELIHRDNATGYDALGASQRSVNDS
ncbi:2024_t:CDS:2, partial [Cetraspora pellucida]